MNLDKLYDFGMEVLVLLGRRSNCVACIWKVARGRVNCIKFPFLHFSKYIYLESLERWEEGFERERRGVVDNCMIEKRTLKHGIDVHV